MAPPLVSLPAPRAEFDEITHPNARAVLSAYAWCGNLTEAVDAVGVSRSIHYVWLDTVAGYQEAFSQARGMFADRIEREATRRALEGLVRYRFHPKTGKPLLHPKTGEPYFELEYDTALHRDLLKAKRPDEYNIERHEHTGKGGGPIENTVTTYEIPSNGR